MKIYFIVAWITLLKLEIKSKNFKTLTCFVPKNSLSKNMKILLL